MKRDITYKYFQGLTKDKDRSVEYIIKSTLQKTLSMFVYDGLPPTIPAKNLEYILQTNGTAFITEIDGNLYALQGTRGGVVDVYNEPTQYTVTNVALNLSKVFDVDKNGCLCKNDFCGAGLVDTIGKYAALLTDAQISLNTAAVLTRLTMLISASDDKTKQSADIFIEKILNGDLSVIAENAFMKGVNLQSVPQSQTNALEKLIELNQYYKANLLNEIGLNAQFNMKRERLNENEIMLNVDEILPFTDNMLFERKTAIERVNEMYGTSIEVDLNSAWKLEKETNDKAITLENTITESENNFTESTNNLTDESEQTDDTETQKIVEAIREMREQEREQNEQDDEKIK